MSKKPKPVVIHLGAGKRTITFNDTTIDLNALDKKAYGAVMRGLRQGYEKGSN